MNQDARVQELRRKHETLSEEIEKAVKTPGFDDLEITELKKRKLRLKEEIHRLDGDG